jgi:hypothetical protein
MIPTAGCRSSRQGLALLVRVLQWLMLLRAREPLFSMLRLLQYVAWRVKQSMHSASLIRLLFSRTLHSLQVAATGSYPEFLAAWY